MASKPSRDQKRKKKLEERRKKAAVAEAVVPYEGNKYRGLPYLDFLMAAECAIHEADVLTQREFTDRDVKHDLEDLVRELRGEKKRKDRTPDEEEEAESLFLARIRWHWEQTLDRVSFRPSDSDLAGVLRTIIDSLNVRTHMTPGGRGYLIFIEDFVGQMGFAVREISPEDLDELEVRPSPDEDNLWETGSAWIADGDPTARPPFLKLAQECVEKGELEMVRSVFLDLEKETNDILLLQQLREERRRICGTTWTAPEE